MKFKLVSTYIKVYKKVTEILCWVLLIATPICGFIGFGFAFDDYVDFNILMALLGAVVGFVVAIIFEFITIPPLMILFEINSKLDFLEGEKKISQEIKYLDKADANHVKNNDKNEKTVMDFSEKELKNREEDFSTIFTYGKLLNCYMMILLQ